MQTPTNSSPNTQTTSLPFPVLELFISVATVPLLVGLVGGKALAEASQEIGKLAEEIFRGDRLPLLNLSNPPESSVNTVDPE
jgi:hypothetical protein